MRGLIIKIINSFLKVILINFKKLESNLFIYIFLSLGTLLLLSDWLPLRVSKIHESHFIDLQSILTSASCYESTGNKVYQIGESNCNNYIYGRYLLILINFLHINSVSHFVVGLVTMIILLFLMAIIAQHFYNTNLYSKAFITLVYFSPGVWFLLERANIDSWIFILLSIAVSLMNKKFFIIGLLLLTITVTFKFYTLFIFLILLFFIKNIFHRVIILGMAALSILNLLKDLSLIESDFPFTIYSSFGSPSAGIYIHEIVNLLSSVALISTNLQAHIFGLIFFSISTFIIFKLSPSNFLISSSEGNNFFEFSFKLKVFVIFGTTFLSSFLFGMNYDYRLIFAIASSLILCENSAGYRFNYLLKALIIISFWFSAFTFGLSGKYYIVLSIFGDAANSILASFILLNLINLCKKANSENVR